MSVSYNSNPGCNKNLGQNSSSLWWHDMTSSKFRMYLYVLYVFTAMFEIIEHHKDEFKKNGFSNVVDFSKHPSPTFGRSEAVFAVYALMTALCLGCCNEQTNRTCLAISLLNITRVDAVISIWWLTAVAHKSVSQLWRASRNVVGFKPCNGGVQGRKVGPNRGLEVWKLCATRCSKGWDVEIFWLDLRY